MIMNCKLTTFCLKCLYGERQSVLQITHNTCSKVFILDLWICLEVVFKIILCCLRHKAQCWLDPKLSSKADFQAKKLVGFEVYRKVKACWDHQSPLSKLKQTNMAAKFNKTTFIWSTAKKQICLAWEPVTSAANVSVHHKCPFIRVMRWRRQGSDSFCNEVCQFRGKGVYLQHCWGSFEHSLSHSLPKWQC